MKQAINNPIWTKKTVSEALVPLIKKTSPPMVFNMEDKDIEKHTNFSFLETKERGAKTQYKV